MKKIVVIAIMIASSACTIQARMTVQGLKDSAKSRMQSAQKYMQDKMGNFKFASEKAFDEISARAVAAKQSTEEFIKAHQKELVAAGLIVVATAAAVGGAAAYQQSQNKKEAQAAEQARQASERQIAAELSEALKQREKDKAENAAMLADVDKALAERQRKKDREEAEKISDIIQGLQLEEEQAAAQQKSSSGTSLGGSQVAASDLERARGSLKKVDTSAPTKGAQSDNPLADAMKKRRGSIESDDESESDEGDW